MSNQYFCVGFKQTKFEKFYILYTEEYYWQIDLKRLIFFCIEFQLGKLFYPKASIVLYNLVFP